MARGTAECVKNMIGAVTSDSIDETCGLLYEAMCLPIIKSFFEPILPYDTQSAASQLTPGTTSQVDSSTTSKKALEE
ncbi:hypothetical protein MAPG_10766 [Magnaporthiopsis poae ATCC 64411]|uniref:Uncharacterized protein n=1 Tax=Magnaporthiopsis poae (strain ATCC 64411 / 73-15) TaxID=644358 RepID=A0A0C4EDG7_MAGP6|nr:hypothetical protein MAPG_10766 [Magnaporthiopsis poae ATCC 64411]